MDDLGLNRALELLEFWQRDPNKEAAPKHEFNEAMAQEQFHSATAMMGSPDGIPAEMRDAIDWAEDMKKKMKGGNG